MDRSELSQLRSLVAVSRTLRSSGAASLPQQHAAPFFLCCDNRFNQQKAKRERNQLPTSVRSSPSKRSEQRLRHRATDQHRIFGLRHRRGICPASGCGVRQQRVILHVTIEADCSQKSFRSVLHPHARAGRAVLICCKCPSFGNEQRRREQAEGVAGDQAKQPARKKRKQTTTAAAVRSRTRWHRRSTRSASWRGSWCTRSVALSSRSACCVLARRASGPSTSITSCPRTPGDTKMWTLQASSRANRYVSCVFMAANATVAPFTSLYNLATHIDPNAQLHRILLSTRRGTE